MTFKVLNSVIRMRRHGGTFMPNREYPIRSADQYMKLKELEADGEVMLTITDKERKDFEAEFAKSEEAAAEDKANAEKSAGKPKASKAKAKKTAKAKADAEAQAKAEAEAGDDADGDSSEDDEKSDI